MTWHVATALPQSRRAARRRGRGVTSVEYVLLVAAILLPSVVIATTCFVNLVGWYSDFVSVVSRPQP